MPIGLHISLEEIDRKIIVRIDGRIDASSAPILERKLLQLIDEEHPLLLLDFTRVDYLSSAGMRVLLSATKKLKSKKGDLLIFAMNEDVLEIVRMAGFDRILHLCSSEKEALQFHKNK
jgi:anti-sigma B factor antagonist/stage II sporulation protein AA (anti-sigma F factor antagonist)